MKYFVNTNKRILISLYVFLVLIAASLVPVQANNQKVVKVGYYENDNFQAGASDSKVKSGYSYEYMCRLQAYTNWNYKYVYGEYGDLYEKLVKGEIDILTGLAYKEERVGIIGYPKLAMGDTPYTLLKKTTSHDITSEPSTLNGKKIGVLVSAMQGIMESYLKKNNVNAKIVLFTDIEKRDQALQDGTVDVTIVEGNGTGSTDNVEAFAEAGSSDYFVCTSIKRKDILKELNEAQSKLFEDTPKLKTDLNNKWFKNTAVTTTLTENEQNWVKSHKTFTLGYYNEYLPFCATDSNGKVTGVIKELLPDLFKALKIKDIKIKYKGYDSYEQILKALRNHEIDASFPTYVNYWASQQYGLMPTTAAIKTSYNLIYKGKHPNMDKATIALRRQNALVHGYINVQYPNAKIVDYESVEEALDAVKEGKADATLINGLRTDYFIRDSRYSGLRSAEIPGDVGFGFATLDNEAATLKVLSHGISLLEEDYVLTRSYKYEVKHKTTVSEFMKDNLWLPILFAGILGALIVFFVTRELQKKKDFLEKEKKHKNTIADVQYKADHDALTGVLSRSAFDQIIETLKDNTKPLAFMIMDIDYFKTINDTYGHVVGDQAIKYVSDLLTRSFRDKDMIIRYGGDEFIVIFTRTNHNFYESITKKIEEINNILSTPSKEGIPPLSVSAGIAEFDHGYNEEVFKKADIALYHTKEHGRKGCSFFDSTMSD